MWLEKLLAANRESKIYNEKYFSEVVSEIWLNSCYANSKFGPIVWKKFSASPLKREIPLKANWKTICKFRLKTIV
jgi:hypothetical protein